MLSSLNLGRRAVKKDFPTKERKGLAKDGAAMSDGSYPITNAEDLKHAISLVGMSKSHSEAEVKAHIISRAKSLGLEGSLPDSWKAKKYEDGSLFSRTELKPPVEKPVAVAPVQKAERLLMGRFTSRTDLATKAADTMEENPAEDSLPTPKRYTDALRSGMRDKLKRPVAWGAQNTPMNSSAISAAITNANS